MRLKKEHYYPVYLTTCQEKTITQNTYAKGHSVDTHKETNQTNCSTWTTTGIGESSVFHQQPPSGW